MTDPELTPAQNEAVRRLLADARHDEPMPPEVVDRLDSVLHGLRSGEAGTDDTSEEATAAPVTPLRKRSRVPQLLLAAAAVVAVGFGVTQVLPTGDNADSDAGSQADSSVAEESPENGPSALREQPGSDSVGPKTRVPDPSQRSGAYSFLDAERGERLIARIPVEGLRPTTEAETRRQEKAASRCGPARLQPGERRAAATYADDDAVVVLRAPSDGKRQADIYVCDPSRDRQLLTSVTLRPR